MEISSCSRDDVSVIYILGPTRTSQIYLFIKLNPSVVVKNKESLNAVKVSLQPDFLHEGRFRHRFSRFLHGRVHQSDFQFSKKKRKLYLIKVSQNSKTG